MCRSWSSGIHLGWFDLLRLNSSLLEMLIS
jgi:hypothetical protein